MTRFSVRLRLLIYIFYRFECVYDQVFAFAFIGTSGFAAGSMSGIGKGRALYQQSD